MGWYYYHQEEEDKPWGVFCDFTKPYGPGQNLSTATGGNFDTEEEAAARVNYLNGGTGLTPAQYAKIMLASSLAGSGYIEVGFQNTRRNEAIDVLFELQNTKEDA